MSLSMIWVTFLVILVFVIAPAAVCTGAIVLVNNLLREKKLGLVDSAVLLFVLSVCWWMYMTVFYL